VSQERTAIVTLYKGNEAVGDITFAQEQEGGAVKLSGTVSGLTPGKHGFHVHEKGAVRNECVAAGGHFNPEKVRHLLLQQFHRHRGSHAGGQKLRAQMNFCVLISFKALIYFDETRYTVLF
jgi:Cu/Zn superoxide dismutase